MADAVAPKGLNTSLNGTLIPSYSSVAYGLSNDGLDSGGYPDFSAGYGSTKWSNAIEIGGTANGTGGSTVYYAIYSDLVSQGYAGSTGAVAWSVNTNSGVNSAILSLVNKLPEMNATPAHPTFGAAMSWLYSEGYLVANRNYPRIGFVDNQMAFAFDPTFMASYPWTGINLYDLVGNASQSGAFVNGVAANVDTSTGATPYLTVSQTPTPQSFIKLDDAVAVYLADSRDYITFSLWFKVPTPNIPGFLLHVQDSNSYDKVWFALKYDNTGGGSLSVQADPRGDGGVTSSVQITSTPIAVDTFYCATIQLDLVSNELKAWVTASTDPFSLTPTYNAAYSYPGIGSSAASSPQASALGAKINKGFATAEYVSDGIDATFGSLHIYTGSSPFTADMAQAIFNETVGIY